MMCSKIKHFFIPKVLQYLVGERTNKAGGLVPGSQFLLSHSELRSEKHFATIQQIFEYETHAGVYFECVAHFSLIYADDVVACIQYCE